MRKFLIGMVVLALGQGFTACNDYETYGELKEKERDAISGFIADSSFVVIGEEMFRDQGYKTIGNKQFVLLEKSGVYMQIVRQGCGEKIQDGESVSLLCRFYEQNIKDQTILYNDRYYVYDVDKMNVTRNGSTYTATFTKGKMHDAYGANVPEGWLVPLQYVNVGRPAKEGDEISKVRLIVPHSQGTTNNAKSNVLPFYYEITFQRGR